jgi:hypothetical protein
MEKAKDYHPIALDPEMDGVGKPPEQPSAKILVDLGVSLWIPRQFLGTGVEHTQEFLSPPPASPGAKRSRELKDR